MPFTAQELANVANAALDFFVKGDAWSQVIQERPLFRELKSKQKTFPGGKDNISLPVKGVYTTAIQGFSHDDRVSYSNPANIKRAVFPWKEIHAGIQVTLTELKKDGISVVDSMNGKQTAEHSDREMTALTNILDDKLEDMAEGWARTFQTMLWQDGTQDAKQVAGVQSIITEAPTTGITGGIDRAANSFWRNRASLAINTATPANQNLVTTLQREMRQLRRFRGKPSFFPCGSDFLDAFEQELRSKGNYTLEGWAKTGRIDASVADLSFKGVNLEYEPTLDDLGKSKYGYLIDTRRLNLWVMDGEDDKQHTPARPADQYVIYRAMTWTGGMCANQLNCHGVYSIL